MKAVDFFCGAGGVTCGFMNAGIDVLAGLDIEGKCRETYENNNVRGNGEHSLFLNQNIAEMQPQSLRDLIPDLQMHDDQLIMIGCSPCQYYTHINTDKSKSAKTRTLLEEFRHFVAYYEPGYVFIENVPGLNSNPESPLGKFKAFLTEKGYEFSEGVVNAKYFQVPQNRRRYILVATRLHVDGMPLRLPEGNKENLVTVRQAIGAYPEIGAGYVDRTGFQHSAAQLSRINQNRIRKTPHDGGGRLSWASEKGLQLPCYKGHQGHTDVYGRMYWDRPSPTITTRFCSLSNGRYGHPEQDRAISLREGATLQSFPENYIFYSQSMVTVAKMIGNAVPPKLAQHVGEAVCHHYETWLDNNRH